jgi:hypothetical protein
MKFPVTASDFWAFRLFSALWNRLGNSRRINHPGFDIAWVVFSECSGALEMSDRPAHCRSIESVGDKGRHAAFLRARREVAAGAILAAAGADPFLPIADRVAGSCRSAA